MVKKGAGTLTLLGNNDYLRGTTVEAGTLIGNTDSLPAASFVGSSFTNNATLVFDQGSDGTFDGVIKGTGVLVKTGAGTLSITDAQTYTGTTTVEAGTLALSTGVAETAGAVTVDAGGTLAGIGTVGGNLTVAGSVAPGNSIGTLTIEGTADFGAGSRYRVEVDATPDGDLLAVSGAVTIDADAGLEVVVDASGFTAPESYTILTSGASVSGPFQVLTELAFLDLSLAPSPTSLMLTVTPNGKTLLDFATTPNQQAVATGFTSASGNAAFETDLDTVKNELQTLSAAGVSAALDAMSGEQLAPLATQRLAIAQRFHSAIDERLATLQWRGWESFTGEQQVAAALRPARSAGWAPLLAGAVASTQAAAPALTLAPPPRESGLGGWLDGYGLLGSQDGDGNAGQVDYQIGGGTIGIDYRFLENFLVGIAGGYAHTATEVKHLAGEADIDTGQVGVYLGQVTPRYYVDVAGRFGYSSMETKRGIDFMSPARTARADFDGVSYGVHVSGGLNVADFAGVVFQPVARFDYVGVDRDSFTESGADSLDLAVASEHLDSITTQLGARLFGQFQISEGLWFLPELRARWVHEFGDTARRIDARMAGATTTPGAWEVSSVRWPRDTAVLGIAWTVTTKNHLQLYVNYDATLGNGVFDNGFGGGFRLVW